MTRDSEFWAFWVVTSMRRVWVDGDLAGRQASGGRVFSREEMTMRGPVEGFTARPQAGTAQ